MDTKLIKKIEKEQIRTDLPEFGVGDTIAVHTILREKDKTRVQIFKGIVIKIKGSGPSKSFTIRKISMGIGVEKIFPIYSTNIKKIDFIKKGKVRRSKIYYMRKRIGKKAVKITEGTLSESMKKQHEMLDKNSKESAAKKEIEEVKQEQKPEPSEEKTEK
jgi:large subunit ribosomal protein L19